MSDNPKHRREGVPLDGAPDLGRYTPLSPIVPEPVTTSGWASQPDEYVAPSPVAPEIPAAPTVSEYQYAAENLSALIEPDGDAAMVDEFRDNFGDDPDTHLAG